MVLLIVKNGKYLQQFVTITLGIFVLFCLVIVKAEMSEYNKSMLNKKHANAETLNYSISKLSSHT